MATVNNNKSSGDSAEKELNNLKEAIIDLYLAIKIRSTEEVRIYYHKSCFLITIIY